MIIFDLLNKTNEDLFNDKKLIDKETEFYNGLYTAFMLINHEFIDYEDTEEKYVEKCINFILNNKQFNMMLKNVIMIKLKEENNNIFESLFCKNVFKKIVLI